MDRIVRGWRGASERVGKSIPQLKRDVNAGRFPAPIELGPNSIAWLESWVDEWLRTRPRRRGGPRDRAPSSDPKAPLIAEGSRKASGFRRKARSVLPK